MFSNLPPGVTESMIPGNRAEDMWFDRMYEQGRVWQTDEGFFAEGPYVPEIGPFETWEKADKAMVDALWEAYQYI